MSRTLTLEIPDEAYDSLVRAGHDRGESPESVASQLLTARFSDPLMSMFGCLTRPRSDVSRRHDSYIGEGILAEQDRD
jgi:hypothetical protein